MELLSYWIKVYIKAYSLKRAKTTTIRVRYQLKAFTRFLESQGVNQMSQVNQSHLMAWLLSLRGTNCPLSVLGYETTLRGFIGFAVNQGAMPKVLWPWEGSVRRPKALPKSVPTEKELQCLLDNEIPEKKDCRFLLRALAIVELSYSAALRLSEVGALNLKDMSETEVRVFGKGSAERIVPLGKKAREAIETYIQSERWQIVRKHNPLEEALFVTREGRRMHPGTLAYLIKTLRGKARWTHHSLRHACATHMLLRGANIRVIQKLLGHKKLSSTQIYTHLDKRKLAEVLQTFHPRG